jgi:hypothetical protein
MIRSFAVSFHKDSVSEKTMIEKVRTFEKLFMVRVKINGIELTNKELVILRGKMTIKDLKFCCKDKACGFCSRVVTAYLLSSMEKEIRFDGRSMSGRIFTTYNPFLMAIISSVCDLQNIETNTRRTCYSREITTDARSTHIYVNICVFAIYERVGIHRVDVACFMFDNPLIAIRVMSTVKLSPDFLKVFECFIRRDHIRYIEKLIICMDIFTCNVGKSIFAYTCDHALLMENFESIICDTGLWDDIDRRFEALDYLRIMFSDIPDFSMFAKFLGDLCITESFTIDGTVFPATNFMVPTHLRLKSAVTLAARDLFYITMDAGNLYHYGDIISACDMQIDMKVRAINILCS